MCSLQEHIEREIRARQAEQETTDVEETTENVSPAP
ncbi:hypothetical protein FBY30_2763 [Arthrobacter sp. SLBN-83]|nr:hypothetical protein FBY30_2763 [Arthrobacter sp. SLBN-83]